jgi:DNA polymerase III subunit epsilon
MRWTDCRVVAFDTETTGLNPFDGDRVVEFGAVELHFGPDGGVTQTTPHQMFVNPEMPIPRSASKISGITDDDVADAPVFAKVANRIRSLLEGSILIAHNLAFDLNFIRVELEMVGLHWPATRAEVDTLPLSQRLMSELRSHKLSSVCTALDVPLDNAHRASHDAEACGRVLAELARRKDAPADLDAFVEWADAVSPPPDTGHLKMGPEGVAIFTEGAFAGDAIERHPDHLQWMTMALERRDGRWVPRFPDSVQQWARRWLRVRAAARGRANPRSQGAADWNIDPSPWDRP